MESLVAGVQNSALLTCKLVSCCCWWAMVCFTKTLLMLCSMAYFFAWRKVCQREKESWNRMQIDWSWVITYTPVFSHAYVVGSPFVEPPAAPGWEAAGQASHLCPVHSPSSELSLPEEPQQERNEYTSEHPQRQEHLFIGEIAMHCTFGMLHLCSSMTIFKRFEV